MSWSISNWLPRASSSHRSSKATGKYLLDAAVLEKRLLFSATPIAPPVIDEAEVDSGQAESLVVDVATSTSTSTSTSGGSESNDGQRTSRLQLVFVDAGVEDHQQLIDDLRASNETADLEIYLLDGSRDGVEQITEILSGYQNVDAIHLLSHGNDAKLRLGNSTLDGGNLAGYAGDFAHWQASLTAEADLLLYGCELAETDSGVAMLEALAALTGADVAASTDDTGHASLGGDWELEYVGGIIESDSILDLQSNSRWKGVLSAPDIAATGEIRVNGTTTGVQTTNAGSTSVAVDDAGNSIVVWTEQSGLDGDGYGIFARRFNDQGIPLGAEFKVNETVAGSQSAPVVAMDSSGRFVIAWVSDDGSGSGIYLRRFNADGTAIDTNDLLANAAMISGDQKDFDMATNASGQIVIVFDNEGPGNALWARTFDFTAAALGDELPTTLKSIAISGLPTLPSVDINDGGRIVFAWQESSSIYSASYDFAGLTAVGPTHELNGGTVNEREIVVAVRSDNDYVVAFRSDVGGSEGVWTRLIPEAGPSGMQLATLVSGGATATSPSIDIDDSDNFVITYQKADAAGTGTYKQAYTSNMVKAGGESLVNQTTAGEQTASSIAIHDYQNAVVVWSGNGTQAGHVDGDGVFLRQFSNTPPVADLTAGAPYTINEGDSLTLDGSNSSDADGDTLTYAWDLDNDGIFGETNEPLTATAVVNWATLASFGIDDEGTYTIGLQVNDGNGGVTTATTTVTVINAAPVISATGAANALSGSSYTLNLSATDPGDDTITSWRVDWGDGTIVTYGGNPSSVTHTYSVAGLTHNLLVSATDEDGTWFTADLFVASNNTTPVSRYDALTGVFQNGLGTSATLTKARGIRYGADGLLYVSGFDSSNVQRFNPVTGAYVDDFVVAGSGGIDQADGLAFGPDGHLYVTSHRTDEVYRYNGTTGAFIDVFVTAASGGLDHPFFIDFGQDGNLYVASEKTNSILRYNGTTGAYLDQFITTGLGGLTDASGFGFGPDGNFYLASTFTDEILRYNGTTGAFIDVFVTSGLGGLDDPQGIEFGPDGFLYVTGKTSNNVLRYDTSGNFIDEYIPASSGLLTPGALEFSPAHQVTVLAVNTAPLATNMGQTIGYTEDDSTVAIADIVVTDPDVGETITATLTLNLPAT
ncbi:DUF4347 domain-containing protein, partial [Stieleria sp.]|uniref:DUF4347 domain-containing protein n=1 Tax=Stieleria sp. TaxID=2795976 RepID=UPI0035632C41